MQSYDKYQVNIHLNNYTTDTVALCLTPPPLRKESLKVMRTFVSKDNFNFIT